MTSLVELALPAAIKAIVSGLISVGGEELKKQKNKIIQSLNSDKIVNKYIKNSMGKVFVFRTLLHGDRNVYLHEVYYPLNIKNITTYNTIKVDDHTILPQVSPICIIGIAGQGKTTIMRKLFLEELNERKNLPVFINLRQIVDFKNVDCAQLLLQHLNSNGIEGAIEDANYLCVNSMVSFFFDGFDEIPFSQRMYALDTIGQAYEKYGCKVIVTTRPDTEITRYPGYDIYNVEYLKSDMLYSVINKVIKDADTSLNLKDMLKKKDFIRESIKTPILLDIFLVTSRNFRDDPKSITDYYSGLFSALLYRHDLIKNLTREKKSGLVDRELEKCFSLFSFLSYFNNKNDFSRNDLLSFFDKSIKANKVDSTPEKVTDDIVDGTNLIVKDGYDNFVYIHRSIQEYFSARFISTMKKDMKKSVYDKLVENESDDENTNLLVMSSYLDPFCFAEMYIIKRLSNLGVFDNDKIQGVSYEEYRNSISEWLLVFSVEEEHYSCESMISTGGEIWNEIRMIYSINSILLNGESHNFASPFAQWYMLEHSGEIQKKLRSGELKPDSDSEELLMNFTEDNDEQARIAIKLSAVYPYIPESEKITRASYEEYLGFVDNINNFLQVNYFDKIEGDGILGGMINDLGFD